MACSVHKTLRAALQFPGAAYAPSVHMPIISLCGGNHVQNLELLSKVEELAKSKGVTPGQLTLAWVHHQGEFIDPSTVLLFIKGVFQVGTACNDVF